MKSLTDDNFRELFRPVVKGNGFITDASRRQEIAMLKRQNFLTFKPLQFNIFYFAAAAVVVISTIAALIGNNVENDKNAEERKPEFHTLKREVPVPKKAEKQIVPIVKDSTIATKPVVSNADTSKPSVVLSKSTAVSIAKKLLAEQKYLSEGLPKLFVLPHITVKESKTLLPKMPDSLPPQKKPLTRKPKPIQSALTVDTGRTSVQVHKADSSPAPVQEPIAPQPIQSEPVAPDQN